MMTPDSAPPRAVTRPWFPLLGRIGLALVIMVVLWNTVVVSEDLRGAQLSLAGIAGLGAVLSIRLPVFGMLLAGIATVTAWALDLTADPFLLAGIGVFTIAERRGSRRFPWWLVAVGGLVFVITLSLGPPDDSAGFEDRMRNLLLSALVLGAAWLLGVRTRRIHEEASARARAEERLRLARDVHDALSHSLGAIGVSAGIAAHVEALGSRELRNTLRDIESRSRESLADLKLLLQRERTDGVGTDAVLPTLPAQLDEIARTAEAAGIQVELDYPDSLDRLPVALRTTAYRIVQEAVTNSIRHARASQLQIILLMTNSEVTVSVHDDGTGVRGGFREGYGLTGMRERVALLDGDLRVGADTEGFCVQARLPFASPEPGS